MENPKIYQQYMYSYPHKTAYRPLPRSIILKHLRALEEQSCGLYLHLPFCAVKCGYCNLFSVAVGDARQNGGGALIDSYLDAIARQLEQMAAEVRLSTIEVTSITLGGGTPSLLSVAQLERLFDMLERSGLATQAPSGAADAFETSGRSVIPMVIELAPNQTDRAMIQFLQNHHFTRVSIGVQSFHQDELTALRRCHTTEAVHRALSMLREAHFPCLNLDLIYGIPGQTWPSLRASLQAALSYCPDELFLYPLYLRPETPLAGIPLNEATMLSLYLQSRTFLLEAGYAQTSMRRFARRGDEPHTDCGFEHVLAVGCGGRSYLGNLHLSEPYATAPRACRHILEDFLHKDDYFAGLYGYLLDDDEQRRRYALKNLLHRQGLSLSAYTEHFGSSPQRDFPFLSTLHKEGMVVLEGQYMRLTETGLAHSDRIGPLFISLRTAEQSAEFIQKGGS